MGSKKRTLSKEQNNGRKVMTRYTTENLLRQKFVLFCKDGDLENVMALYGDNVPKERGLETAAKNGRLEVVKFLIESGTNPACNNSEPIKLSYKNGHSETRDYLLGKMTLWEKIQWTFSSKSKLKDE